MGGGIEVVDHDDLVATRDQPVDDVGSDEAGTAGHDDSHVTFLGTMVGMIVASAAGSDGSRR
jgi:hypothetical protein